MRARPVFVGALALALVGLAAYLVVPPLYDRLDRAAQEEAARAAARVPAPAGAEPMSGRVCGFGDPVRCFRVDRDVPAVTDELAAAVRQATGQRPHRECYDSFFRTRTERVPTVECYLRVETGYGHAVHVRVETHIEWPSPRNPSVDGTRVIVAAD